jgi:hypothetical protein
VTREKALENALREVLPMAEMQRGDPVSHGFTNRTLDRAAAALALPADPAPAAAQPPPDLARRVKAAEEERDLLRVQRTMTVHRLGGLVEGQPTHALNFLQRIDALIATEAAAQAVLDKVDRLQDALDRAPPVPGQRLLPRAERESAEHKALRAALAGAAQPQAEGAPGACPERLAEYRCCQPAGHGGEHQSAPWGGTTWRTPRGSP